MLRRRLVPPLIALLFGLATVSPLLTNWPSEGNANKWTLFGLAGMFVFKAVLFWWMRQRMCAGIRVLTRFGAALVDWFTAIVLADLALVLVFGIAYWYARDGRISPLWLRLSDRSALVAGGVLVIATGAAVAYEMRVSGATLRVHVEPEPPRETDAAWAERTKVAAIVDEQGGT